MHQTSCFKPTDSLLISRKTEKKLCALHCCPFIAFQSNPKDFFPTIFYRLFWGGFFDGYLEKQFWMLLTGRLSETDCLERTTSSQSKWAGLSVFFCCAGAWLAESGSLISPGTDKYPFFHLNQWNWFFPVSELYLAIKTTESWAWQIFFEAHHMRGTYSPWFTLQPGDRECSSLTSNKWHLQNQKAEPQNAVQPQNPHLHSRNAVAQICFEHEHLPFPSTMWFGNVLPLLCWGAPGADDGHHHHHHHGDDADGDDDDDKEVAVLLGCDAAMGRVHLPDGGLWKKMDNEGMISAGFALLAL